MQILLHQVWVQGEKNLPEKFVQNRILWRQAFPEIKLVLWDEKLACEQWEDFKKYTDCCYHHATRADLILARAVRDFGGLACGTDSKPNNPNALKEFLISNSNMVVKHMTLPAISNGLQWSKNAGHSFWKAVAAHQIRDNGKFLGSKQVNRATGPYCYMEVFFKKKWDLNVVEMRQAYTRDSTNTWQNPNAFIDAGYAGSWCRK